MDVKLIISPKHVFELAKFCFKQVYLNVSVNESDLNKIV